MVYKRFIVSLLVFNIFCHAQESQEQDQKVEESEVKKETLNLVVGIKKIVKLDFEADFSNLLKINNVGNKLTMKPVQGLNEIIFEGKKPGSTNIIVKNKIGRTVLEYNVIVTETDQSKTVQEIRDLVGDIEGVEIGIQAGRVVVDGEVIVPRDMARLSVILEQYRDKGILVLVEPSAHTMEIIAKRMQNEIWANGMRDVTVRVVNDAFWLEGVVNDRNNSKIKAQDIAVALLPERIIPLSQKTGDIGGSGVKKLLIKNFIEENVKSKDRPLPKLVKIAAQFVELSKDYARTFGFRWAPTLNGNGGSIIIGKTEAGTLSSASEGSLTAVISNLFPKLAAARNAGNARVLQSGMVITEDTVKAEISKGTSIPFETGSGEFSQGQQANSTFKISTVPSILKQEKVKLANFNISVSIITGQTSDGKPLQTNNSVNTTLIVNSGDSAVVGGIFQSQSNTAYDKLPSNPEENTDYLFNFIRAKDYKISKNQFVVFVTPEVIDSASRDVDQIKRKFRRRSR